MSDDITIKDLVRSPPADMLHFAMMHLLSLGGNDFLERFKIDATNHDNTVKVELRINGVEVSPREVFAELDRQHTTMVKREAARLLEESCGAGMHLLQRIEALVMHEAREALGSDWEDR